MKKFILKLSILMTLPIILMGCGSTKNNKESDNDKIKVMVSISPLKEFTESIGGDKVKVSSLIPDNVEPHDFDFKPKDVELLKNSQVFIYNGLGMEDWLDKVETQDVNMVDSSKNADVRVVDGKKDPHLWLSLKEAINQGNNIKEALVQADPNNKDYYEENYNKFKEELDGLFNEYKPKFDSLNKKDFMTSHAAFGYLCRDFGIDERSLTDVFGEGEILPQTKKELIDYCKQNGITTVFSESSDSQKDAESMANDINGKVEPIYSIETKVKGKSYLEAMRFNLEKIYESLNQ